MEIADHLVALRREGTMLADAAARADLGAPVPGCPGWRVGDLVRHIGDVHRWAGAHVARRSPTPITDIDDVVGPSPDDAGLIDWYRASHSALLDILESAEPDVLCFTFLPAPSPLAFWARRQAHETGIHRADAESAGGAVTPFPARFAADGVDELLLGFLSRPGGDLTADPPRSLHLHATDTDGEWLVVIGPERIEVRREHARGDCAVRATASDIHLLLWNRRSADGLEVHGDAALLDHWREKVQVSWSRKRRS